MNEDPPRRGPFESSSGAVSVSVPIAITAGNDGRDQWKNSSPLQYRLDVLARHRGLPLSDEAIKIDQGIHVNPISKSTKLNSRSVAGLS